MKYTCLVYVDEPAAAATHAPADLAARLAAAVGRSGAVVLAPDATRLRRRNGTVAVVAGSCAEGEEHLAALVVIDAADLDAALAVAERLASPELGIEVRPIRELVRRGPRRTTSAKIVPLRARD